MRDLGISRPVGDRRTVELGEMARQLYESGLNLEQVARRCDVGKTSVAKCLREMGVEIRPSGSRFTHLLTEQRLRKLYVGEGRPVKLIANNTRCSKGTVYRLLAGYRIRRPRCGWR